MTIDEIRKAKQEAEQRIRAELKNLSEATGLDVGSIDVEFVDYRGVGPMNNRRRAVGEVHIELRVP